MDRKKLTRRAVLGSAIGGAVVANTLVLRSLRGRYGVEMPTGPARAMPEPGSVTATYTGKITTTSRGVSKITTRSSANGGPVETTHRTVVMEPRTETRTQPAKRVSLPRKEGA